MNELLTLAKALNKGQSTNSKPTATVYEADASHEFFYFGPESQAGIMTSWGIPKYDKKRTVNTSHAALLDPNYIHAADRGQADFANLLPAMGKSPPFLHVTQPKFLASSSDLTLYDKVIKATGDTKEFGPGFYTMSADSLASGDCGLVGAHWFEETKKPWSVLGLTILKTPNFWRYFLLDAASSLYIKDLVFYLTTCRGYPRGGKNPTQLDIAAIEAINKRGKALIFPDDDSTKIVVNTEGKKLSAADVSNSQGALLPGLPWVVIGPQRPEFMKGARQVAWKDGLGLWLINMADRFIVYNNQ